MIGTGSQTVGPFFHVGLRPIFNDKVVDSHFAGQTITIRGRVIDGDGVGVPDAMVEIWQADPHGEYVTNDRHDGFSGFGRVPTGPDGSFEFTTAKPGRVAAPDGTLQAPHVVVTIFMRGLLRHLNSRIYFPDEPANTQDLLLKLVEAGRRHTLVAREIAPHTYEWTVNLQGEDETVFFDF